MKAVMQPQRPAWVPDDLYPFTDRYIEIEGHQVHYVDEGSGPPVLFLHGNPTWSFAYRGLISRLSDRFRCLAIDYPGFGLSVAAPGYDYRPVSHARVLDAFVERLGLDGLTLFVHDWGGPIGLWVAGRRPARIRALVIGNTWAWPADRLGMRFFSALLGGPLSPLLIERLNLFVNVFLPGGVKRRRLSPAELAAYRGPFPPGHREPIQVLAREIVASRDFLQEVEDGLSRLTGKPALIAWADRDVAFKESALRRWELLLPRHRTILLENVGHYLQEDAPDEIADAIWHWWTRSFEAPPLASETGRARTAQREGGARRHHPGEDRIDVERVDVVEKQRA
jgi:haloalkane dehalogenase